MPRSRPTTLGDLYRDVGGHWDVPPTVRTPRYVPRLRPRWWSWRWWVFVVRHLRARRGGG